MSVALTSEQRIRDTTTAFDYYLSKIRSRSGSCTSITITAEVMKKMAYSRGHISLWFSCF